MKYYIYHIPGVKIGVTQNIKNRVVRIQKCSNYEILEEHTCVYEVSKREIELQKQYGYRVDHKLYYETLKWQSKCSTPNAISKRLANTDWEDFKEKINQRDWKLDREQMVKNTDWASRNKKIRRPVNQYDLQGNLIKQWESAKLAAMTLGKCVPVISNAINDPKQKTAYGFIWKYA
jgi:hypothetical protein